jgi:hypothetical protein
MTEIVLLIASFLYIQKCGKQKHRRAFASPCYRRCWRLSDIANKMTKMTPIIACFSLQPFPTVEPWHGTTIQNGRSAAQQRRKKKTNVGFLRRSRRTRADLGSQNGETTRVTYPFAPVFVERYHDMIPSCEKTQRGETARSNKIDKKPVPMVDDCSCFVPVLDLFRRLRCRLSMHTIQHCRWLQQPICQNRCYAVHSIDFAKSA